MDVVSSYELVRQTHSCVNEENPRCWRQRRAAASNVEEVQLAVDNHGPVRCLGLNGPKSDLSFGDEAFGQNTERNSAGIGTVGETSALIPVEPDLLRDHVGVLQSRASVEQDHAVGWLEIAGRKQMIVRGGRRGTFR